MNGVKLSKFELLIFKSLIWHRNSAFSSSIESTNSLRSLEITFDNVPDSKKSQSWEIRIKTVYPYVEHGQAWITAMIYKMRHIAEMGRVHCVGVVLSFIEIQIE